MKTDFGLAFTLFSECFETDEKEARIILEFAEKHGKLFLKKQEDEVANMICLCEIKDKDFCADYLFACCTKEKFRKKGIFKNHLFEIIGSKSAVLIPENETLFGFYEKLGFVPIKHLEIMTDAFDDFRDCEITKEELFEAYKSSCVFPKKDFFTFCAAIDAFLHYGGSIKEKDGIFMTVIENEITEIFAKSRQEVISLLKKSQNGKTKLLLPFDFKELLAENEIDFSENTVAMAKNVPPSLMNKIYLNNLFN
jgi:hypothetical protein